MTRRQRQVLVGFRVVRLLFQGLMLCWAVDAAVQLANATMTSGASTSLTAAGSAVGAVLGLVFTGIVWTLGNAALGALGALLPSPRRTIPLSYGDEDLWVPAPRIGPRI